MVEYIDSLAALPFVTRREDGALALWSPDLASHASWADANAQGRQHAAAFHDYLEATGDVSALGAVVRAMIDQGVYGGAEAGFCNYIGRHSSRPFPDLPSADRAR